MRRLSGLFALILTLILLIGLARLRDAGATTPGPARPGNHTLTLQVDGRERAYILHVPPQAQPAAPLPLVLVLHGTYGSGRKMQLGLGFDAYADARGFMVAYPDAYQGLRWNDGRGTLDSARAGIDDVAFLVHLVDDVAARAALDRGRVFVTGASNGGMMTYRLGCETSGVFAKIAPVIASIPAPIAPACAPQAPLGVLSINGDADPYIPLSGGAVCADVAFGCEGGVVISAAESLGRFAAANGCGAAAQARMLPALVGDGTQVELRTYPGCGAGADVRLYVVHGGGHSWPPRAPQLAGGGAATGNLDATQVIVDFFLQGADPGS